ncbi:MAG TPA: DUF3108 domain-containing protein [Bacteroidales bacterium]|nr:DUF3108 domain-containing protein [Bacteroidales bacterium]
MKKSRLLTVMVCAMLLICMQAHAQDLRTHPNKAWDTGEFLRFRVYYNSMLTGNVTAGEATIEVKSTSRRFFGREVWHIEAHGRTKGAFNWFFKVKNRYESFVDKEAVIPYLFIRRTREGSYVKDDDVYFYPQQRLAVSKSARKPIPENVHDFVSALYYMRTLDLDDFDKEGNYYLDFFLDDSVYNSKILYLGREEIKIGLGTFRCLKIAPMMATGNVFADAYPMFVWVTDDENHLPLLAESKVIVGSVKMELVEVRNLRNPMRARLR